MGLHGTSGDRRQLRSGRQSVQPQYAVYADRHESTLQHFDAISPKIGFVYRTTPTSQLYFNASRAYEAPSIWNCSPRSNANGTPNRGSSILTPSARGSWNLGHRGTSADRRYSWDLTVYNPKCRRRSWPRISTTRARFRMPTVPGNTGEEAAVLKKGPRRAEQARKIVCKPAWPWPILVALRFTDDVRGWRGGAERC